MVGPLPLSLLGPVHASVCLIDLLNSRAEGREFMPISRVDIFLEIVSGFVLIFAQASGSWVSPFAWKLRTLGFRRGGWELEKNRGSRPGYRAVLYEKTFRMSCLGIMWEAEDKGSEGAPIFLVSGVGILEIHQLAHAHHPICYPLSKAEQDCSGPACQEEQFWAPLTYYMQE